MNRPIESASKLNESEERAIGNQIVALEAELTAIKSSSAWRLGNKMANLTDLIRRILRKPGIASSLRIIVTSLGPETRLTVSKVSKNAPHDLTFELALNGHRMVQERVDLHRIDNTTDSDIAVKQISDTEWELVWTPSKPIGDYSARDLSITVGGFPDRIVTYRLNADSRPSKDDSQRQSLQHLMNSVKRVEVLATPSREQSKIAILSTYIPNTRAHTAAVTLISQLKALGYTTIIVDTSPKPSLRESVKDKSQASIYMYRKNVGWDFSSWIAAMVHPDTRALLESAEELLWLNDSCFGPLTDMSAMLSDAREKEVDFWGLTSSIQIEPHLQSYFLRFSKRAIDAGLLSNFIADYNFPMVKSDIIQEGEVRLTSYAKDLGLSVGAAFAYEDIVERYLANWDSRMRDLKDDPLFQEYESINYVQGFERFMYHMRLREYLEEGIPRNASHEMWDTLLDMGCPLLKRELVLSNPQRVPLNNLHSKVSAISPDWAQIIATERGSPTTSTNNHIQRPG